MSKKTKELLEAIDYNLKPLTKAWMDDDATFPAQANHTRLMLLSLKWAILCRKGSNLYNRSIDDFKGHVDRLHRL